MDKNSSVEMNKSILLEYGIRVKTQDVPYVVEQLFLIAKTELTQKLEERFTITDLIDPNKTTLIFELYLEYFSFTQQYGSYLMYPSTFMSYENELSNDFISRNRDRFKDLFSQYLDNNLSAKNFNKIPEAYIYYLASFMIFNRFNINHVLRHSSLLNNQNEGPFSNVLKNGCELRQSIPNRNLSFIWDVIQDTNLLTDEQRTIAYRKMFIAAAGSHWYLNHEQNRLLLHNDLIMLIKFIESDKFHKSENEIQIMIDTAQQ